MSNKDRIKELEAECKSLEELEEYWEKAEENARFLKEKVAGLVVKNQGQRLKLMEGV